jgi:hypothetical protein
MRYHGRMERIPGISRDRLNKWFRVNVMPQFCDDPFEDEYVAGLPTGDDLGQILKSRSAVLGFDIYRYSSFEQTRQPFVPVVVDEVVNYALHLLDQNYKYLSQFDDSKELRKHFIDTGDGGYFVLQTPLHAIALVMMVAAVFQMYNSYHFIPALREQVGPVSMRYALAFGNVYRLRGRLYGEAIITCARLLSRDRLNRFLIDAHSHDWFVRNIAGMERLLILGLNELSTLPDFENYDNEMLSRQNALIASEYLQPRFEGFRSIDVQKIGSIRQKEQDIDAYNVHMQAVIQYVGFFRNHSRLFAVTVGNLNAAGISE